MGWNQDGGEDVVPTVHRVIKHLVVGRRAPVSSHQLPEHLDERLTGLGRQTDRVTDD